MALLLRHRLMENTPFLYPPCMLRRRETRSRKKTNQALSYHLFSSIRFLPNAPKLPSRNEMRPEQRTTLSIVYFSIIIPTRIFLGRKSVRSRLWVCWETKWTLCERDDVEVGFMSWTAWKQCSPRQNDGMMAPETHCEFLPTFFVLCDASRSSGDQKWGRGVGWPACDG